MKRILIVDDKEPNLYYLQALLAGNGYVVDTARHGAEALVKARQSPPCLVISDLLMPVMDGYTLLRLWKADERLKTIPFIVYTATYTEPEDERLARSLGADAFILKPAEPEDFLARIREVEKHRAAGTLVPSKSGAGDEKELLKIYSETLIRKLEEKTLELEEANRALLRDIAERRAAEQKLSENETLLTSAQRIGGMGSWVYDCARRHLTWSDTTCELFGVKPAEFAGTFEHFYSFILPEDRPAYDARHAVVTPVSPMLEAEYRIRRPDGQIRWMYERGTIVFDAGGRQVRRIGMVMDITGRKQTMEELQWKTAFLEAQVDSSMDGILVVDAAGRKILQNRRLVDLWQIPPDITANPNDAVQVEFVTNRTKNPRQFADRVAWLNAHPDDVSREEIELVDGTVLDRYSSPVRDKADKYYGRIWAFRDITQQRKLEMQLRQAQKMEAFGQLAGGVAHDFNNMLAVIQLQAGLLKTEPNLSLHQLDIAHEIENTAERAANLTRQLLLFSRKQTIQLRDLNLKDQVENMTKMLRRTLGEKVELQFKFSREQLFVHADPGMMDQILLNLAVNARDAMPEGGRIIIETAAIEFDENTVSQDSQARVGSFACLAVSDTGCGIPAENLARIFEPFFTTKEPGRGTGLGLATVFGIVQQHKGWINVYSKVGHGSTFRVYLPRQNQPAESRAAGASPPAQRGGGETILFVEDDASVRRAVRRALGQLGYRVIEAETGDEALALWPGCRNEAALLLTDLVMPGRLSGRALGDKLLADKPGLKVVYTSGYSAEVADKNLALEDGVNFLAKPYEATRLARVIRARLDG